MNGFTPEFTDRLEPLGVAAGAFLVFVGFATVLAMPWTTLGAVPGLVQVIGALGTAAIGAGLAYLSWTGRE